VTALARLRSNCTVNYRTVLSSERALQNNKPATVKGNFKEKEKLVAGPRWVPDTKTDWPTCKLTSTSTTAVGKLDRKEMLSLNGHAFGRMDMSYIVGTV
jgi:hypothetical protein